MSLNSNMDAVEYQESTTVTLDWTLRGLKQLFDSSKGESKSKVTKSIKFGGGRWQILFYANSGTEGGGYVSLYLSCEPTKEENENAAMTGRWVREGLYKFTFELRNTAKTVLFNQKDAFDHSFSYKTANWGWAQFARRDAVYYQPSTVRHHDAFLIICTITSSPSPPSTPPLVLQQSVPLSLLGAVGAMLDDPLYSDVEFVLPGRRPSNRHKGASRIFATKRLLRRANYFEAMFNSGFAEASESTETLTLSASPISRAVSENSTVYNISDVHHSPRLFEDSDAEDDEDMVENDESNQGDMPFAGRTSVPDPGSMFNDTSGSMCGISPIAEGSGGGPSITMDDADHIADELVDEEPDGRNVRAKLSHPSSPRQRDLSLASEIGEKVRVSEGAHSTLELLGPKKTRVEVRDVAYATYRAVLYYLYTDTIQFAPLSSSFLSPMSPKSSAAPTSPYKLQYKLQTQGEGQNILGVNGRTGVPAEPNRNAPTTRKAWLREWEISNPGKVPPCSAKAVYRLADKLDLEELKNRAFQHIIKSMTVETIPYEMFSTFTAMFEDVRQVQINYFLENWSEIRNSDAMKNIWQQIRVGRHPGFEEVWPLIAVNLEFKPRSNDGVGGDGKDGPGGES